MVENYISLEEEVIYLQPALENKKIFNSTVEKIKQMIFEDFSDRNMMLKVEINGIIYECKLNELLIQMILLTPHVDIKSQYIPDKFIILKDINRFNGGRLNDYFDMIVQYYFKNEENIRIINTSIKKVIEELADISGKFNIMTGTSINIYDIIQLDKSGNKEFSDLIRCKIPNNLEFNEIESYINDNFKKLIKILEKEETHFKDYLDSNTGIKKKQLQEVILNIGLKPDLEGNIIPEPINTNFLMGMNSILDYYTDAIGARKALVTNFKRVKESGYLTRKLSLLMIDNTLDVDCDDCGSTDYVNIFVGSDDIARRLDKKWFLNEDTNELELFSSEHHKSYLGKTVKFRSPATCHNHKVCKKCYGDLYKVNKDIHIGLIAQLYLTSQITQRLLSSKHLLQTNSEKIEWGETFNNYFYVDKDSVYPDSSKNSATLIFDPEEVITDEENRKYTNKFLIKEKKIMNTITTPKTMYLSNQLVDFVSDESMKDKDGNISIPFKMLANDTPLFTYVMDNIELSASLNAITDLIESTDHIGISTIDDFVNKFLELLSESDIKLASVHAELILRSLIRDAENETELPSDYSDPDKYTILKLSTAVIKSKSPSPGLVFERVKYQIESPDLYLKDGESILDILFVN